MSDRCATTVSHADPLTQAIVPRYRYVFRVYQHGRLIAYGHTPTIEKALEVAQDITRVNEEDN